MEFEIEEMEAINASIEEIMGRLDHIINSIYGSDSDTKMSQKEIAGYMKEYLNDSLKWGKNAVIMMKLNQ